MNEQKPQSGSEGAFAIIAIVILACLYIAFQLIRWAV